MLKYALALILALGAPLLKAQTTEAVAAFKGESEASVVMVDGNSKSETIGAKTKNEWTFSESDKATIFGSYLKTKANDVESAKSWNAGIRYDRTFIANTLDGFIQHQADHDPYNGVFVQRDSTDVGAKYDIIKTDDLNWFAELGYRYTSTYVGALPNEEKVKGDFARVYTEVKNKFNSAVSGKLWFEYLSSFDTKKNPNRWNAEASLSVTMTSILSLKTAYLIKHTDDVVSPLKADATTFTTAIVANY